MLTTESAIDKIEGLDHLPFNLIARTVFLGCTMQTAHFLAEPRLRILPIIRPKAGNKVVHIPLFFGQSHHQNRSLASPQHPS